MHTGVLRRRRASESEVGALLHRDMVPEEVDPHIFFAVLIDCQMYSSKGTPPNLLLNKVLVNAVLGGSVILAVAVLGAGIEGFLELWSAENSAAMGDQNVANLYMAGVRECALVVSEGTVVCGRRPGLVVSNGRGGDGWRGSP